MEIREYLVVVTQDDYEYARTYTETFGPEAKEEAVAYANAHSTWIADGRQVNHSATVYGVVEVIEGVICDGSREKINTSRQARREASAR